VSGEVGHSFRFEVEMYMFAFFNVRDRWVLLVNKLQVNKLAAGANSYIEILVIELDGNPNFPV
jgi:hypothetical protein